MKCDACKTEEFSYWDLLDCYPDEIKPESLHLFQHRTKYATKINTKILLCKSCFQKHTKYASTPEKA